MNGVEQTREEICPVCGKSICVEGVDVEVGYYYPPLYCENCGWNEKDNKVKIGKDNMKMNDYFNYLDNVENQLDILIKNIRDIRFLITELKHIQIKKEYCVDALEWEKRQKLLMDKGYIYIGDRFIKGDIEYYASDLKRMTSEEFMKLILETN